MKISIDTDRCQGHGTCYVVAPDLFTDDDRGYGQVRADGTVEPAQHDAAQRAIERCPERAISLES